MYTKYIKWIAVISTGELIVNNDNLVQFISSSTMLQNKELIQNCNISMNHTDFCPYQSINWLTSSNQIFVSQWSRDNLNKTMKTNLSSFSLRNNQTIQEEATSINWSTLFNKIVSGSLHNDMEGNLSPYYFRNNQMI